MKENSRFIQGLEKANEKLSNLKTLRTITNGLVGVLPLIIVGAILSLIANFPVTAYQNWLVAAGLKSFLALGGQFTTNIIAIIACLSITYTRVTRDKLDAIIPTLVALVAFLMITPLHVEKKASFIAFDWLGAPGFFVGILLGLAVGASYSYMIKHNWTFRLPDQVPPMVAKSIGSIVPTTIILLVALLVRFVFSLTSLETIHNVVYTLIQQPFTHVGNSIWALLLVTFVARLFWFIGIHGMLVVMPILLTVFLPLDLQNLAAFNAGQPLPNIVTVALWILCTSIGGGGATLGFNFLMAFRAKSEQYGALGKLALPAGLFGINEPLTYGVPLVFNVIYAIPYIFVPVLNLIVGYLLIKVGVMPAPSGATILGMPLPIFFAGLMEGSWKLGVFQLGLLVLDTVLWYPFFRAGDAAALKQEQALAKQA
ncbi:PTS sugar transporter subunit IIC [Lacticaseibacillus suihuaensis]